MGKPGSLIAPDPPPVQALTTTRVRNVPPFSTSAALLRQTCAVATSSLFVLPVSQCVPCCLLEGPLAPAFMTASASETSVHTCQMKQSI